MRHDPDHVGPSETETSAPRQKPDPERSQEPSTDRDALHPADYGGRREPDEGARKQGGVGDDEAQGGGRAPVGERDRDYDPDGDRTGR